MPLDFALLLLHSKVANSVIFWDVVTIFGFSLSVILDPCLKTSLVSLTALKLTNEFVHQVCFTHDCFGNVIIPKFQTWGKKSRPKKLPSREFVIQLPSFKVCAKHLFEENDWSQKLAELFMNVPQSDLPTEMRGLPEKKFPGGGAMCDLEYTKFGPEYICLKEISPPESFCMALSSALLCKYCVNCFLQLWRFVW